MSKINPELWREEFRRKFEGVYFDGFLKPIPDFITSLLSAIKDEVGKERRYHNDWDDLFKGKDPSGEQTKAIYTNGHNSALTKVEDIISKAIKG